MAEAMQAQNDPAARSEFLNKCLNIYTNTMALISISAEVQISMMKQQSRIEKAF